MKRISLLLLLFVFTAAAVAQNDSAPPVPANSFLPEQAAANGREEELYKDGTDYLNEAQWQQAADKFAQVAALKGRRADAGLYWQAYALNKMGQRSQAMSTLDRLRQQYPKSEWLKDAGALEVEMKQSSGQTVNPATQGDEELKMLALNGLMNSDSERAVPMLQSVLASPSNSPKLKERALFILAQSDSDAAQKIIGDIARGQSGPELQVKAIRYIGVSGTRHTQALQSIYASSTDNKVKKAILNAYMVSGDKAPVLAAAKSEKDPELRRSAIHQLGAMGAKAELMQMYQATQAPEDQREIIQSLGVAGDVDGIEQIAKTATDPKVRATAIRSLGIFGGDRARGKLLQLYTAGDAESKKAALDAMFVNGDATDLITLARKETDPEMKRKLVEKLSIMGGKEARDYMLEILNH